MSYFVGAYAASPNTATWNPELEAQYYAKLSALPNVKGLEHPFLGSLHPHDDAWFISHIDPKWRFVFTCIPGVMAAMAKNPLTGLASDDASGRQEALAFVRQARDAIATLNAACGSHVVDAIEIQSAPDKTRAASSVASLTASLAELVQWDWQGARVVIEHCDAHVPGQVASKGFLSLADEITAIEATNTRYGSDVGIVVNWGRSVLEARSAQGALDHIQLARRHGVLAGLMFSGASGQDTPYGAWRDSHMPPAPATAGGMGAEGSLLTVAAMHECMVASDGQQLPILGLKIGIRPLDATLESRMAHLSSGLERLDAAR